MRWRFSLAALTGVTLIGAAVAGILFPETLLSVQVPGETVRNSEVTVGLVAVLAAYGGWAVLARNRVTAVETRTATDVTDEPSGATESADSDSQTTLSEETESTSTSFEHEFTLFDVPLLRFGKVQNTESAEGRESASADGRGESESEAVATDERPRQSTDTERGPRREQNDAVNHTADRSVPPRVFESLRDEPPETVQQTAESIVGSEFEELVGNSKVESSVDGPYEIEPPAAQLHELLADLERQAGNVDGEHDIDTGAWTDDRVAAAFLSRSSSVSPPFVRRLLGWLDPETEIEYAASRAVSEIAETHDEREERS